MNWTKRHKETLIVLFVGLLIIVSLNVAMLYYNLPLFTKAKGGFWSVFWNHFEISGFDPYTYIVVSKWRPLYILSRHPLLAFMMWPFSQLNAALMEHYGMNCAIFIVGALWVMIGIGSWMLMYKILHRLISLGWKTSLLITFLYFGFSHVMLVLFVSDHMAISQLLILLAIYLAGRAIRRHVTMPLWQTMPLAVLSMGVTTTNIVKLFLADFFTASKPFRWKGWGRYLWYLVPVAIVGALYLYQLDTTQAQERRSIQHTISKRAEKDTAFAAMNKRYDAFKAKRRQQQIIHSSIITNTEYHIDRLPSLQENIFGEGILLHETYTLKDTNKNHRPVLVRYSHWWDYLFETVLVALFAAGAWIGRRNRLMQMALAMFLFDMLLHVGLNFASADVYIMTAHWAYVVPFAIAYLTKHAQQSNKAYAIILTVLLTVITAFLWIHNLQLMAEPIF